jgi:hypothetical protein
LELLVFFVNKICIGMHLLLVLHMISFRAENLCMADALVAGIVNKKVHSFMTFDNMALRVEVI